VRRFTGGTEQGSYNFGLGYYKDELGDSWAKL
jgi:hypothetical protein